MKKIFVFLALFLMVFVGTALAAPQITANFNFEEIVPAMPSNQNYLTVEKTFSVANTGTDNLKEVNVLFTLNDNIVLVENNCNNVDLATSEACTVKMKFNITKSMKTGADITFGNAAITAKNSTGDLVIDLARTVSAKIKSMLDLYEIKVAGTKINIGTGATEISVKPGQEITIEINLENLFDDDKTNQDVDINDILAELFVEGMDGYSEDLELEEELNYIISGGKKKMYFKFAIPYKINAETYSAKLDISSEDDNGFKYDYKTGFSFVVKKDLNAVRIIDATLSPEKLSCAEFSILKVKLMNLGRRTEENVVLRIISPELGLDLTEGSFDMSRDPEESTYERNFEFTIYRKNLKPGTYSIEMNVYYDNDKFAEKQVRRLTIEKCETDAEEEEKKEEKIEVIYMPVETATPPQTTPSAGQVILKDTSKGFFDTNTYLVFLGIGILIILLGIVTLIKKI